MSDSLSYPELWLLELGCINDADWLPMVRLVDTREVRRKGFSEQWNFPPSGLTGGGFARVVWELWRRRELKLRTRSSWDDEGFMPSVPAHPFVLHSMLIEDYLRRRRVGARRRMVAPPHRHYLRVTEDGIRRWEEYAQPDWSRYRGEFTGELCERGETTWSQSAANELFAREVLEVNSMDAFHPGKIHWETTQVEYHRPWQPFDGKQLPEGVTVSVRVTEFGQRSYDPDEWEADRLQDQEYHRRLRDICRWYKNGVRDHPDRPKPGADPS